MSCSVVAVFDHALCGSYQQYVMYCCCCLATILRAGLVNSMNGFCCLATMLRAGLVDSVSCIVVGVWRPCFVCIFLTLYVMYCCGNVITFCSTPKGKKRYKYSLKPCFIFLVGCSHYHCDRLFWCTCSWISKEQVNCFTGVYSLQCMH